MRHFRLLLAMVISLALLGGTAIVAEAGWLDDAVKKAIKEKGEKAVDEASDSTYDGSKSGLKKTFSKSQSDENDDIDGEYDEAEPDETPSIRKSAPKASSIACDMSARMPGLGKNKPIAMYYKLDDSLDPKIKKQAWDGQKNNPPPSEWTVGIPSIPGVMVSEMKSSNSEKLPNLSILAPTEMDKVIDFFKKTLKEDHCWNYDEKYKIFFRSRESKYNSSAVMSGKMEQVYFLENGPEGGMDTILMDKGQLKKMKTRIQIVYRPAE